MSDQNFQQNRDDIFIYVCHSAVLPDHTLAVLSLIQNVIALSDDWNLSFCFCGDVPVQFNGDERFSFLDFQKFNQDNEFVNEHYIHNTPNSRGWEVSAIVRWWPLMRTLVERKHKGRVLFMDSDIFLYSTPRDMLSRFSGELGMGLDKNPGVSHFASADVVIEFCDFMARCLTDLKLRQEVANYLRVEITTLQEMSFIAYFCHLKRSAGFVVDNVINPMEGRIIDYSVNFPQPYVDPQYLLDDFGKIIAWENNIPYFLLPDGQRHRVDALHIHGTAKAHYLRYLPKNFDSITKVRRA